MSSKLTGSKVWSNSLQLEVGDNVIRFLPCARERHVRPTFTGAQRSPVIDPVLFNDDYRSVEMDIARRMRMSNLGLYHLMFREMFEIIVESIVHRTLASRSTVDVSTPEALAFVEGWKMMQAHPNLHVVYRYYIW